MPQTLVFNAAAGDAVQHYTPVGDETVLIECWGPGGLGADGGIAGGQVSNVLGGQGGGGGAYAASIVALTGGVTYNLVPLTTGPDPSWFSATDLAGAIIRAAGGTPGLNAGAFAAGGTVAGSIGDTRLAGGDGGNNTTSVTAVTGSGGGGSPGNGYITKVVAGNLQFAVNPTPTLALSGLGINGNSIAPGARGTGVGLGGLGGAIGADALAAIAPGGGGAGGGGVASGPPGTNGSAGGAGVVTITRLLANDMPCSFKAEKATTATGTDVEIVLDGADSVGFNLFSGFQDGSALVYRITNSGRTVVYERGLGFYNGANASLTRTNPFATLDGSDSQYNLPGGTKLVAAWSIHTVGVIGNIAMQGPFPTPDDAMVFGLQPNFDLFGHAQRSLLPQSAGFTQGTSIPYGIAARVAPVPGVPNCIVTIRRLVNGNLTYIECAPRITLSLQDGRAYYVTSILVDHNLQTMAMQIGRQVTNAPALSSIAVPAVNFTMKAPYVPFLQSAAGRAFIAGRALRNAIVAGTKIGVGVLLDVAPELIDAVSSLSVQNLTAGMSTGVVRKIMGRLSVTNNGTNADRYRVGQGRIVSLVPLENNRDAVISLWTQALSMQPPFVPSSPEQVAGWPDIKLVTQDNALAFTVDLATASPIPFTYTPNLLPAQDHTYANVPADIFACFGLDEGKQLFYLNWGDRSARSLNGVGHSLVKRDGMWCLNTASVADGGFVAGFNQASLPATSNLGMGTSFATAPWFFDPRRFVYLGTVCGPMDGMTICQPGQRMMWNLFNALPYTDITDDTTRFWTITPEAQVWDYAPMNPGMGSINWAFSYLNAAFPGGLLYGQRPICSAQVTALGSLSIALARYKVQAGIPGQLDGKTILTDRLNQVSNIPNEIVFSDVPSTITLNEATQAGLTSLRVEQRLLIARPDGKIWGFWGSSRPAAYNLDHGVVLAPECDGDGVLPQFLAGPARFTVTGEC